MRQGGRADEENENVGRMRKKCKGRSAEREGAGFGRRKYDCRNMRKSQEKMFFPILTVTLILF